MFRWGIVKFKFLLVAFYCLKTSPIDGICIVISVKVNSVVPCQRLCLDLYKSHQFGHLPLQQISPRVKNGSLEEESGTFILPNKSIQNW